MSLGLRFISKEKFSIGLDIGTQLIKMVKLRLDKEGAELCAFGSEPHTGSGGLGESIKGLLQSQEAKEVNISLSGLTTVIRHVPFPRMNNDELKQALKFEAQKHIPFALNEVNIDACIIKDDLPDNKMLVLIAAAKKDAIEERLKLAEGLGLKINAIDIDSIALINAFSFNYPFSAASKYKVVALLNVGSERSNLNILEEGIPHFSRDIHIGGRNFTQRIADILGIDFKAAEKSKVNPEKEIADKLKAAIEPAFMNLASEIRSSFDYYESQSASCVSKIFLSGGGGKFLDFKGMLTNSLGTEVDYWDPLQKIDLSKDIDSQKIKQFSGELAVAVGLALRQ